MKKILIACICMLAVIAVALATYGLIKTRNNSKSVSEEVDEQKIIPENDEQSPFVNFYLHDSYAVDTSVLFTEENAYEQFTYFELVYSLETFQTGKSAYRNFTFPEFDFTDDDIKDKYLAVSFGREVLSIEKLDRCCDGQVEVAITYAEEYHDNTMFVYFMDKVSIFMDEGSEFYIMKGTDKEFVGYDWSGYRPGEL